MTKQLFIGIGAGLAAALPYASASTLAPLAILLFYLGPLPIFIAALGWGLATSLVAAAAGALTIAAMTGLFAALVFLCTVAGPVVVLGHLARLSRQTADGGTDWYPPGRIATWSALMSAGMALLWPLYFGFDRAGMEATTAAMVEQFIGADELPDDQRAATAATARLIAVILVPATTATWAAALLFNLWLAGRVLRVSDRLPRPWPDLHRVQAPEGLLLPFVGALALAFAGGALGLVGEVIAAALVFVYVLIGLSVVHCIVPPAASRAMVLTGVYLMLLLFPALPLLVLAGIGIGEPHLRLRDRAAARRGGPPAPPGPD